MVGVLQDVSPFILAAIETYLLFVPNSVLEIGVALDLLEYFLSTLGQSHHDGSVDLQPLAFFLWFIQCSTTQDPEARVHVWF